MLKKPLVIGVMLLLLCSATVIIVSASGEINTSAKENASDGRLLTQHAVLQNDGQARPGQITVVDDKTLPKGVETPQSWKNLTTEKREPTEKDWAFIKDSMKDLPEEDKDKLVGEFKKILEGKSELSDDEQREVCRKIGQYILEATEGSSGREHGPQT